MFLTGVRKGEFIYASWDEIDFDAPLRQTSCRLQIPADDPRRSDTKCEEIDIHQSFKNRL